MSNRLSFLIFLLFFLSCDDPFANLKRDNPLDAKTNSGNNSNTTFTIGQSYGGGIIFYIDGTGQHGLISAASDQSTGAEWGCKGTTISGANGAEIGAGNQNTTAIITGCTTAGIAAKLCYDLVLNGYNDWVLPSKGELDLMYANLAKQSLGGFTNVDYWSSSGFGGTYASALNFNPSYSDHLLDKDINARVRAIRAF